jgi:hypothetical protein
MLSPRLTAFHSRSRNIFPLFTWCSAQAPFETSEGLNNFPT